MNLTDFSHREHYNIDTDTRTHVFQLRFESGEIIGADIRDDATPAMMARVLRVLADRADALARKQKVA